MTVMRIITFLADVSIIPPYLVLLSGCNVTRILFFLVMGKHRFVNARIADFFKATGFYLALPRDALQDVRAWLTVVSAQPAGRHSDRQGFFLNQLRKLRYVFN